MFINHAASMIQVFTQVSFGILDTVRDKEQYDSKWRNIELQQRAINGTMIYANIMAQSDLNEEKEVSYIPGIGSYGTNESAEFIFKAGVNSYNTIIHHVVSLFPK